MERASSEVGIFKDELGKPVRDLGLEFQGKVGAQIRLTDDVLPAHTYSY